MNFRDLKLRVRALIASRRVERDLDDALGLGLVAVVFTFYSALFLRVDAVRDPGQLFEVRRLPSPGKNVWVPFTRPQYEALRRETSVFTDAFAMLSGLGTRIDGRAMRCTLVTGNFFEVVGVSAALGRTLTPADDERFAGRPVMVLSQRGWIKLFKGDPAVIGRTLRINGVPYEQEIGVRMALGATTRNVTALVLSQSARPVALGLIGGAGLAGTMAVVLMATPAASQIGSTVHVLDPVACAASLLCIVTTCVLAASIPALRAARIDPMTTLRQESAALHHPSSVAAL